MILILCLRKNWIEFISLFEKKKFDQAVLVYDSFNWLYMHVNSTITKCYQRQVVTRFELNQKLSIVKSNTFVDSSTEHFAYRRFNDNGLTNNQFAYCQFA